MFQLILFALLFGLFVYRRMKQMTILERNGIPGPKPNLITGNLFEFFSKLIKPNQQNEYHEKYGKVFGYYLGSKVMVNVTDLELIQQIQIKNFSQFSAKFPTPASGDQILSNQTGDVWKTNRAILSGAFNGAKLKSMAPLINSKVEVMMHKVEVQAKLGNEFNIYDHLKPLTMDVMSSVMMGVDAKFQNNFKAAQQMFVNNPIDKIGRLLSFRNFDPVGFMYIFGGYFFGAVNKFVSNSLSKSSSVAQKENNLIQSVHGKMSHGEAVDNAEYLFVAGTQLTSSALTSTMHFLVNHPEVQVKARKEVLELVNQDSKFDHESMSKLTYLQAVIYETLRYYPPLTDFVTRSSTEDFHYKDIVLPKKSLIQVPLYQLHHTEEYWPKHDQFNPDRFLDKSNVNSIAFQPFGAGPRICLGARFAMLEMKLILAQLLSKYEFIAGPSTEEVTSNSGGYLTFENPANAARLKAVPLN